jgi:hypothetical protein
MCLSVRGFCPKTSTSLQTTLAAEAHNNNNNNKSHFNLIPVGQLFCIILSTGGLNIHLIRCSNFFNPSKKNSFGCAENGKIENRETQRIISAPTYIQFLLCFISYNKMS